MNFRLLLVIFAIIAFAMISPVWSQGVEDPSGDTDAGWTDWTELYFEQQGESLYVAFTFAEDVYNKGHYHSGNSFYIDTDDDANTGQVGSSRVGSENNLTFCEWDADNVWCVRVYGQYDQDVNTFVYHAVVPVNVSPDGKTVSYKFSLVGSGFEEIAWDANGYWLEGTSAWSDPYHVGDSPTEPGLLLVDIDEVTDLVDKEGSKCIIKVPEPYAATADAKNIAGVVDEMVNLVQTEIGTISEASKKYTVTYDFFSDYAHPYRYLNWVPFNSFTTVIPGKDWVDAPRKVFCRRWPWFPR